jgi:hypothetical protein
MPPSSVARLAAIRLAILLGVLMFGAVAWYQRRAPDWERPDVRLQPLRYMGMAAWGVAVVGIIALRLRFRASADVGATPRTAIVAWALGELPALFGAVFYYLTGDVTLFATGLAALAIAFVLFPLPRMR